MTHNSPAPPVVRMKLPLTPKQQAALCLGVFVPPAVREQAYAVGRAEPKAVWLTAAEVDALTAALLAAGPLSPVPRQVAFAQMVGKLLVLRAKASQRASRTRE